jgi:hypothetical protein
MALDPNLSEQEEARVDPIDSPSRTASGRSRRDWPVERMFLQAIFAVVGAGMIIASAVSYQHEYVLARANGQVRWVSALVPFTLDGMIFVAGAAMLWAAVNGVRGFSRLRVPGGVMLAGIAATIAANYYSDIREHWLGPAVSASSGVAVVLMSAVAFWLLGEVRKSARGEAGQPGAACQCPPPPLTVAEALPLARARLKDAGEQYGEQALADRFSVTRHVVRQALTPRTPDPSLNGSAAGA